MYRKHIAFKQEVLLPSNIWVNKLKDTLLFLISIFEDIFYYI